MRVATETVPAGRHDEEKLNAKALIISSDGHASAPMRDYRQYLPAEYHEEFDGFRQLWDEKGGLPSETRALVARFDPEEVER